MAQLIQVSERQTKHCDRCGTLIAFHANRNGKKYAVEVHEHPRLGMVYSANYGNNGNMTGWHDCNRVLDGIAKREAEIAKMSEEKRRNEIASRFVPRLCEIARNWSEDRRDEAESISNEYKQALEEAGLT